ncbi:hypothetical protein [Marinomonas sp. TW1]|uniref:hypothetical protein n=1 Tax=Marinomonas sp. TW1 TaxID=1561203 RepID=UPI0007AF1B7B|nr:hypothetical protein [Marinomonas sp. TW1]
MPSNNAPSEQARFINAQLDRPSRSAITGVKANWTNNNTGEEHTVAVGTEPYKKLRQTYDSQANAQQACQDELIKSQRQGSSVTLDALID